MSGQGLVAEAQVSLAALSSEAGHPEQAEPLLREAIVEFEKESATPALASAFLELSHVLLLQAKLDEARQTIHHAADLSKGSPDPALTLPLAIEEARFKDCCRRSGRLGASRPRGRATPD